jgi:hypothetical protein
MKMSNLFRFFYYFLLILFDGCIQFVSDSVETNQKGKTITTGMDQERKRLIVEEANTHTHTHTPRA